VDNLTAAGRQLTTAHSARVATCGGRGQECGPQSPPTRLQPASGRERRAQPAIQGRKKSLVLWLTAVALSDWSSP
jgi:hypothetical protein